jgi:hypothetical protein
MRHVFELGTTPAWHRVITLAHTAPEKIVHLAETADANLLKRLERVKSVAPKNLTSNSRCLERDQPVMLDALLDSLLDVDSSRVDPPGHTSGS